MRISTVAQASAEHQSSSTDVFQIHNPSVATLYEDALVYEQGSAITSSGALSAYSGKKTGRSPQDKRIVKEPSSEKDVWWGPVNKPMSPDVSTTPIHCFVPSVLRSNCHQNRPQWKHCWWAAFCQRSREHHYPRSTAEVICLHVLYPSMFLHDVIQRGGLSYKPSSHPVWWTLSAVLGNSMSHDDPCR